MSHPEQSEESRLFEEVSIPPAHLARTGGSKFHVDSKVELRTTAHTSQKILDAGLRGTGLALTLCKVEARSRRFLAIDLKRMVRAVEDSRQFFKKVYIPS